MADKELLERAFDLGKKAGRTDGWMFPDLKGVKESLEETYDRRKIFGGGSEELVRLWQEEWEETDHWKVLYGDKLEEMVEDIEDPDEQAEVMMDLIDAFWDGVLSGLESRGIDVYRIVEEITKEEE